MQKVLIYKVQKDATQAKVLNKQWCLEFCTDVEGSIDNYMSWYSESSRNNTVKLYFSDQEHAIQYAQNHQLDYMVYNVEERQTKPKSYTFHFTKDKNLYYNH